MTGERGPLENRGGGGRGWMSKKWDPWGLGDGREVGALVGEPMGTRVNMGRQVPGEGTLGGLASREGHPGGWAGWGGRQLPRDGDPQGLGEI